VGKNAAPVAAHVDAPAPVDAAAVAPVCRKRRRVGVGVIGIDPGGVTGWSYIFVDSRAVASGGVAGGVPIVRSILQRSSGQIDCRKGRETLGRLELVQLTSAFPEAAVVAENFRSRMAAMGHEFLMPSRLNGALELVLEAGLLCWPSDDDGGVSWTVGSRRPLFLQEPAAAKQFATDERLKSWGLYSSSGGQGHARDADRHALLFLRRAALDSRMRCIAWPRVFGTDGAFL
jgi:hypothetical protein